MSIIRIQKIDDINTKPLFLPPSKALSIRVLYLPFLGLKSVIIENIPSSDDFNANLNVIKKLGLKVEKCGDLVNGVRISWRSDSVFLSFPSPLSIYVGNSGLGARFLITFLALSRISAKIIMGEQLARRPVVEDSEHLSRSGVRILQKNRCVFVDASKEQGNLRFPDFKLKVMARLTSQYLSALLFFGWRFGIHTIQLISKPVSYSYVKTTIELLKLVGIRWIYESGIFLLRSSMVCDFLKIVLPPDASIASNFLVLSCILRKKIVIKDFKKSIIEPDFVILSILKKIGAQYRFKEGNLEFYGDIKKEYIEIDLKDNPDLLPILAILLLFLRRGGVLKNVSHTKFKESPRNEVLVRELSKLGAKVEQKKSELRVGGLKHEDLKARSNIVLDCYEDHRIFMAFAVMGFVLGGISIKNPQALNKSCPDFLDKMNSIIS